MITNWAPGDSSTQFELERIRWGVREKTPRLNDISPQHDFKRTTDEIKTPGLMIYLHNTTLNSANQAVAA